MHELSIAESIVDIIHQYVEEKHLPLVHDVSVKVGALAGVVPDSLEFNFAAITADTPLQNARLRIVPVPFVIRCNECGATSEPGGPIAICPRCGGMATKTLSGTELQVAEIEVNEPEEAP
ncbi:hydrogenase maturation nickel metallochaperone HypA [Sphingobacteriales bacterium CHB3]|nr:hydrogenase maturation nickel metallochaperone HypA [Sphingobacteriales bacterium CHB3]